MMCSALPEQTWCFWTLAPVKLSGGRPPRRCSHIMKAESCFLGSGEEDAPSRASETWWAHSCCLTAPQTTAIHQGVHGDRNWLTRTSTRVHFHLVWRSLFQSAGIPTLQQLNETELGQKLFSWTFLGDWNAPVVTTSHKLLMRNRLKVLLRRGLTTQQTSGKEWVKLVRCCCYKKMYRPPPQKKKKKPVWLFYGEKMSDRFTA